MPEQQSFNRTIGYQQQLQLYQQVIGLWYFMRPAEMASVY